MSHSIHACCARMLSSVLVLGLGGSTLLAEEPDSCGERTPAPTLKTPTPTMLATVLEAYGLIGNPKVGAQEYRDRLPELTGAAIAGDFDEYALPPGIAVEALARICEIKSIERRQDRLADWCGFSLVAYADEAQVRIVEMYLKDLEKMDGRICATMVNLMDDPIDDVLFRALKRVEFKDDDSGAYFQIMLGCTHVPALSSEARRTYVEKWREVMQRSEQANSEWARATEDLVRAGLLEGDEGDAARKQLRERLAILRAQSTPGAERIDTTATPQVRPLLELWENGLRGDARTGAILRQYINHPKLDALPIAMR